MADLGCSGRVSSPSADTSVTSLVSTSKPASVRDTSFATTRSTRFSRCLRRALATTSVVSAANPTSSGRSPPARCRPSSARMSGVRTSVQRQRVRVLVDLLSRRVGGSIVGHGGRHDDDVGVAPHAGPPRRAFPRRSSREPLRLRQEAGSLRWSADEHHAVRPGSGRRPQARNPSSRSSDCRGIAPGRWLRASAPP